METQSLANHQIGQSLNLAFRTILGLLILSTVAIFVIGAVRMFVVKDRRQFGRWKYWFFVGNALTFALLMGLQSAAERILTASGNRVVEWLPFLESLYPSPAAILVALYGTVSAMLALLLAIQLAGIFYWFVEARIHSRRAALAAESDPQRVTLRNQMLDGFALANRILRTLLLGALIFSFLVLVLKLFPRTSLIVNAIQVQLGPPAEEIGQNIVDYIPNLAYLGIIVGLGWLSLRLVRYLFTSIEKGNLVLESFPPDWALPTYKLLRSLLLLFLLMVSFPYLPGAKSEFFQGFSLFLGALVTFGSTGAISGIVSGIVLTYTGAFRLGETVRIGDMTGRVSGKTLLVTRLINQRNEEVTIPNGQVLSSAVVNFSARAATEGLVLTVTAGIGYDVDWRTVHELMIGGAAATEEILPHPAPEVWQTTLGDYAVNYELRAWTRNAGSMFAIHSALRKNVLDAFNRAGVEIMTPSILAHRDASILAVPKEQYPDGPTPRGIAVRLDAPA